MGADEQGSGHQASFFFRGRLSGPLHAPTPTHGEVGTKSPARPAPGARQASAPAGLSMQTHSGGGVAEHLPLGVEGRCPSAQAANPLFRAPSILPLCN